MMTMMMMMMMMTMLMMMMMIPMAPRGRSLATTRPSMTCSERDGFYR